MRKVWVLFVLCSVFALGLTGCDKELKEYLDEYYENAPGFCKEMCKLQHECELDSWEDDNGGDYMDEAYSMSERMCVLECALPCAEGVFVYETDEDDYGVEYVDHLSGSEYESFAGCVWSAEYDYYDCDDDQWIIDFEDLDEEYCDALNACYESLDLGWDCSWEVIEYYGTSYEYCECDTDGQYFTLSG